MLHLIRACGPAGWGLLAVSLIILGWIARAVVRRFAAKGAGDQDAHAILFWGGVAAVLGFMSQCAAIYTALTAIIPAEALSPERIARGFHESFVPSFWGFGALCVSALAWFAMRLRHPHHEEGPARAPGSSPHAR